jgi:hypothetical protein
MYDWPALPGFVTFFDAQSDDHPVLCSFVLSVILFSVVCCFGRWYAIESSDAKMLQWENFSRDLAVFETNFLSLRHNLL